MPISFYCPHCGAQTQVMDQFAGHSGPCKQCGQTITIPSGTAGSVAVASPQQRKKSSSKGVLIAVILAVALLCLVCVLPIALALILPAVQASRESARQMSCGNNMREIAMAMKSYEAQHGHLPPAYVTDEDGNLMHSWRVLLLPHLDQQDLYDAYNLDEPWNSPANRRLADRMPEVYTCPSSVFGAEEGYTSYAVVVGPETLFDGGEGVSLDDVPDGMSNTILLVEAEEKWIEWMDPSDIDFEDLTDDENGWDTFGLEIRSSHRAGVNVAYADGRVNFLRMGVVTGKELRALLTRSGGEAVMAP